MLVTLLSVLFILICPLIIFIVLMQDPKGGGLAGVLGGAGGGSAFGAKTADVVMKATVALGIAFFVLAISMSFILRTNGEEASLLSTAADADATQAAAEAEEPVAAEAGQLTVEAPGEAPAEAPQADVEPESGA